MNLDKLEQLRQRRRKRLRGSRLIKCPHRSFIVFHTDTSVRFPIHKYLKRLNKKSIAPQLLRKLAELFKADAPRDYALRHKCERVTEYLRERKAHYVIKV
jgi:hypothetical protein